MLIQRLNHKSVRLESVGLCCRCCSTMKISWKSSHIFYRRNHWVGAIRLQKFPEGLKGSLRTACLSKDQIRKWTIEFKEKKEKRLRSVELGKEVILEAISLQKCDDNLSYFHWQTTWKQLLMNIIIISFLVFIEFLGY